MTSPSLVGPRRELASLEDDRTWRRRAIRLCLDWGIDRIVSRLTAASPVIIVAHRFRDAHGGTPNGMDTHDLAGMLEWIRGRGDYELVSLEELFDAHNPSRKKRIAFTIDDGYNDQVEIAGPVFEAFDCPVTVFLTTGFVDGETWMWWDQVEYVIQRSTFRRSVSGFPVSISLHDASARRRSAFQLVEALKNVPDRVRRRLVSGLAEALEVDLPTQAPDNYAPLQWGAARSAEQRGLYRFGPHTRTHPILAKADDATAKHEIEWSWHRLRTELVKPLPVLALPNGMNGDYGQREVELAFQAGLTAVLTSEGGASTTSPIPANPNFIVMSRFGLISDFVHMRQVFSGTEDLKHKMRSRLASRGDNLRETSA